MSMDFGATLPKDMAAAISLMSHPAAGVAALTAIGFGVAGQAFGMWAGAVAVRPRPRSGCCAARPNVDKPRRQASRLRPSRIGQAEAGAEGRGEDRTRADGRREGRTGRRRREPVKRVGARAEPAKQPAAARQGRGCAGCRQGQRRLSCMPEDFRKPRADGAARRAGRPQGDLGHRAEAREGAERSRRLDLCADRRLEQGRGRLGRRLPVVQGPHRPRRLDRAGGALLPLPPSRPRAERSQLASRRTQHRPAEIPVRRSAGRRVRGQSRPRQRHCRALRRVSSGG